MPRNNDGAPWLRRSAQGSFGWPGLRPTRGPGRPGKQLWREDARNSRSALYRNHPQALHRRQELAHLLRGRTQLLDRQLQIGITAADTFTE